VENIPAERRFDVVALRAVDNPAVALELAHRRLSSGGTIAHLTSAPGADGTAIPVPGAEQSFLHLF
jgi:16S rRNA G527 N7-methylase RsmG